jgi:hypothetical protein
MIVTDLRRTYLILEALGAMQTPASGTFTILLLNLWLLRPQFYFLEMCIQHQMFINEKFSLEVTLSTPFTGADYAIAWNVAKMKMCIVALPGLMNVL